MTRDQILDEALDAFWAVIVTHHPEAETGDLSIGSTAALRRTAEAAVGEWVRNNAAVGG
jgi:hypothetical protein